jgi:hypothetical protein
MVNDLPLYVYPIIGLFISAYVVFVIKFWKFVIDIINNSVPYLKPPEK